MTELLDRLGAAPMHPTGALGFRRVVGATLLYQLALMIGHFDLTLGRESIYPFAQFVAELGRSHYSYLALSSSPIWQWIGYLFALLIVGVWTLRSNPRFGRATTLLTWWAVHSVHSRCPTLWDGGDNLIEIILLYAIPLDLWRAHARGRLTITLHNLAIIACILQVCTLYFSAGLSKLPGEYWRNGTALYYVLASREFGMTGLGPLLWNCPPLLALTTWAPLLLQLGFPFIYLFGRPWPRRAIVLLAIGFHLGIFVLMGLDTFALFMIGVELLLLSDHDIAALRSLLPPRRGLA